MCIYTVVHQSTKKSYYSCLQSLLITVFQTCYCSSFTSRTEAAATVLCLSPVALNLYIQSYEKIALVCTAEITPAIWYWYVDR